MMENREKEFRGKRVDNGDWVYGYFFQDAVNNEDKDSFDYPCYIRQKYGDHFQDFEVIPETVEQYTGLKDPNGKDIYEGDIMHAEIFDGNDKKIADDYMVVVFMNGCFGLLDAPKKAHIGGDRKREFYPFVQYLGHENYKVVGNKNESPELLK